MALVIQRKEKALEARKQRRASEKLEITSKSPLYFRIAEPLLERRPFINWVGPLAASFINWGFLLSAGRGYFIVQNPNRAKLA